MNEAPAKEPNPTLPPVSPETVSAPPLFKEYGVIFTGTSGEYFRIWIVNTFLTILTLGIYAAWAKVRTRRYFYAHTRIADHSFEYLANPISILKGNLIVGGGIILFSVIGELHPAAQAVLFILFYLWVPFFVYKSLRFHAHNSAFCNVRFRFTGSLGNIYKIYLLLLLVPVTLGLIFPYWSFRHKKYFFDHIAYGSGENHFSGRPGPFYRAYFIASLILTGVLAAGGILFFVLYQFMDPSFIAEEARYGLMVMIPLALYIVLLVTSLLTQQYLYSQINNYCWNMSTLETIQFESTLKAGALMWIRFSNILAILFSFGLLIPWAKIRRTRYILDHFSVLSEGELKDFTTEAVVEQSAIGDTATDFFDLDIGL